MTDVLEMAVPKDEQGEIKEFISTLVLPSERGQGGASV